MAKGTKKVASEPLYVASKVKAAIKAYGCNTSGDALDGLQGWITWHVQQAAARAKANGRKTVRAHDFILPMYQTADPLAALVTGPCGGRGSRPAP